MPDWPALSSLLGDLPIGFSQPLALLLAVPAVLFVLGVARRAALQPHPAFVRPRRRWPALDRFVAVRLLLLLALVLALAGLELRGPTLRRAVAFVTDRSASVAAAQAFAAGWVNRALAQRPASDVAVGIGAGRVARIEFQAPAAPGAAAPTPGPVAAEGHPRPPGRRPGDPAEAGDATDLAAGLRLAAALLPGDAGRRVVLLTDGRETRGDALAEARRLHADGITVDVVPLASGLEDDFWLDQLEAPASLRAGARLNVRVRVGGPRKVTEAPCTNLGLDEVECDPALATQDVTVRLYLDGQPVGARQVQVGATGEAVFGLDAPAAGGHTLRAEVVPQEGDERPENNVLEAPLIVRPPPTVLVAESKPGGGANLAAALRAAGMTVETRPAEQLPTAAAEYGSYAGVVLADVGAERLGQERMEALRDAVRDRGLGLVTVGGGESYGLGGYRETPLEEALPVSADVPYQVEQGRVALALVLDKSGSMAEPGRNGGESKMALASQAAIMAIDQLAPDDLIGVVTFDTRDTWTVSFQPVGDGQRKKAVQDRISAVRASGGTNIHPALVTALSGISAIQAPIKHVVLLTDGRSCCGGDYDEVVSRMRRAGITLSTVAIGNDADLGLLQRLARLGSGRYSYAETPEELPRLMTRETRLVARPAVVDEPTPLQVVSLASGLADLPLSAAPDLAGYIVTTPKGSARIALVSPKGDPLLATWHYGLGRVAAWTSDTAGRWSEAWVRWPEFARFWGAVVGWTLPPDDGPVAVEATVEGGAGRLVVQAPASLGDARSARATVQGPDGATQEVELAPTGPGRFEGTFPAERSGAYRVQARVQTATGTVETEAGVQAPYADEYRPQGADQAFLARLAAAGGGRLLESPSEVWNGPFPPARSRVPLATPLLLFAALLLPFDIALRRLPQGGREVVGWLRARLRA